jgi:hypothetical protein
MRYVPPRAQSARSHAIHEGEEISMTKGRTRLALLAAAATLIVGAFAGVAATATGFSIGPNEIQPSAEKEVNRDVPNSQSNAHVPSSGVPRPATIPVDQAQPGLGTVATAEPGADAGALDHFDQRFGADNGNQFSLEPPDQGLCVGNGTVVEAVNDVFAVYGTDGSKTSPDTSLTLFFTGQHQVDRSPGATAPFGPFLSDPKCYFDPVDQRFFMTMLEFGQDPQTGDFEAPSAELIAVSKGSTPTTDPNDWYRYSIDTTNNGGAAGDTVDGNPVGSRTLPTHPGCPCFGDQPLIGADANGFYITSNEFSILGPEFNGAQVYAFDKAGLEHGTLTMQYVAGEDEPLALEEGLAYSLQPATSPSGGDWSSDANGTEYLLSALDFDATLDNRIAAWALTNTASLSSGTPDVHLSEVTLSSEVYGQPPDAEQKAGPTPLACIVQQGNGAKNPNSGNCAKEELLAANDDRMNQAVYADGHLWGAVNTVVKTENGPSHVGSAYFVVEPSVSDDQVSADLTSDGYVAVNQQNLLFPAIGVTSDGKAVYTATLTGNGYYPSAVYATLDATHGPTAVHIAAAGAGPDDGFTGYSPFGGPTGRWGDYSAAVGVGGDVWLATEYIGQSCTLDQFLATNFRCGDTRTQLANWGTAFFQVTP